MLDLFVAEDLGQGFLHVLSQWMLSNLSLARQRTITPGLNSSISGCHIDREVHLTSSLAYRSFVSLMHIRLYFKMLMIKLRNNKQYEVVKSNLRWLCWKPYQKIAHHASAGSILSIKVIFHSLVLLYIRRNHGLRLD